MWSLTPDSIYAKRSSLHDCFVFCIMPANSQMIPAAAVLRDIRLIAARLLRYLHSRSSQL